MKTFVIDPGGRLGNQMIQLMVAKRLIADLPDFEIYGYDMPEWRLSRPLDNWQDGAPLLVSTTAPLGVVSFFCRLGLVNSVLLKAIPLDHRWFPAKEQVRALFQPSAEDDVPGFDGDHIVIHIRGEDILHGKHPDYGPIPLEYYRSVLRETGLKPVFVGQISYDYYSNLLRRTFPDATFVSPRSRIQDFQLIRNSKNIIVSMSSFCWIAAWLSDADRIYMPLIGGWNPSQRPDFNLTPLDDPRFVYDVFPVRHWRATAEQIAALEQDGDFRRVTSAEVGKLRDRQKWMLMRRWMRKTLQLTRYTLKHLVGRGTGRIWAFRR
ncbi:MAG: hypothetical protein H6R00_3534 [Proteobacteria bacterium]|nr:hypothetical protein [Pseudomonadota bacterium]